MLPVSLFGQDNAWKHEPWPAEIPNVKEQSKAKPLLIEKAKKKDTKKT